MVRKDFKIGATSLANEKLWSLWSGLTSMTMGSSVLANSGSS